MHATTKVGLRHLCHGWRVGSTPVIENPELCDHFGIRYLALKDESANYLGTHKDRKSVAVLAELGNMPAELRPEALCILTAGNGGLSLARIASSYGLPVTAFVGQEISPTLHARLKEACEQVIPIDLERRFWTTKELEELAGKQYGRRVYDVSNGVSSPFEVIVDEIRALGREKFPDVIVLPVGSGELFLGVLQGLKKRRLKTRLLGVTVDKNSAADKLYSRWNPQQNKLDKLLKNQSQFRLLPLASEKHLLDTFAALEAIGSFACEPSSAAAFAALHQIKATLKPDDRVLVINTGTFNEAGQPSFEAGEL